MDTSNIVKEVIEQIKLDFANNDITAIEELLSQVDIELLRAFLPELDRFK
jgi:hypothetical protein